MDEPKPAEPLRYGRHSIGTLELEDYRRFLLALFEPRDAVRFRPIETWTENGQKKSRVDYRRETCVTANPAIFHMTMRQQLERSASEHTNIFFGVCPRFGKQGDYDLAWQIRQVNCLWADLDHCTDEEALQRCLDANLPEPSIVVNSGNGVHLYWLLDTPFLIDDAPKPPPIQTAWIKGVKKPHQFYIDEHGDEVPKGAKHLHPPLSAQAQHVQDILGGLAAKIGGDHTTDLTRLLRVPGTMNRKDERNGKEPVPCTLVKCDPDLRYAFAGFEHLAKESPDLERRTVIAKMPLPPVRKKISQARLVKLDDHIARCLATPKGGRSEVDFALCCFAIKNSIAREEVQSRVQDVGKFAEGGERYFERTWSRAEAEVRLEKFNFVRDGKKSRATPAAQSHAHVHAQYQYQDQDRDQDQEFVDEDGEGGDEGNASALEFERDTIVIDESINPIIRTLRRITDTLLNRKTTYTRAGQCVALRGQDLAVIGNSNELAGHLNQYVEFYFRDEEAGQYRPLPANYGNTWLNNPSELERLPHIKLFTRNPVYSDDWRLVGSGYDEVSGIFYAGDPIEPQVGQHHLEKLLQDFCFRSEFDRTNYLAMLLTIPLVYHFIGSKPAILFNGNQPGLGKSILAQILAILRDGTQVDTATYNPNDEEFEKRLGSIVRKGATTIIIDNAKSHKRAALIESACLERSITDPIVSFRLLGSSSDIRAENSHFFCITANAPDVSRDLVTRSIVVNLEYEGDPTKRRFTIANPEDYALQYRHEILGELLGMIERWRQAGRPEADVPSRFNKRGWGRIIGGILAHNGVHGFLANADEAANEFDGARRDFAELIKVMHREVGSRFTPEQIAQLAIREKLLVDELGDKSHRSQVTNMGLQLKRYVAERFPLDAERSAVLIQHQERKGNQYSLKIESNPSTPVHMPNLEGSLPNLGAHTFGTCKSLNGNGLPNLPNVAEPFSPTPYARESINAAQQEQYIPAFSALGKGSAGSARSAAPAEEDQAAVCDHIDPAKWIHRQGKAHCPGCDKILGNVREPAKLPGA
jgi:hypothetical protein